MNRSAHRRKILVRGSLLVILVLLAGGALWLMRTIQPTDDSIYPKCTLHNATGLHCPGCGMTRSLHAALNGDPVQALAYNILSPILLPILAFVTFRMLWAWVWDLPASSAKPTPRWVNYFFWALLPVMMVFFLCRNIPYYPFTLLAPHELMR